MTGHDTILPNPVCACDIHAERCPCECYGCRVRAVDERARCVFGPTYGPLLGVVRLLTWPFRGRL